jgi:hypothetical protein
MRIAVSVELEGNAYKLLLLSSGTLGAGDRLTTPSAPEGGFPSRLREVTVLERNDHFGGGVATRELTCRFRP